MQSNQYSPISACPKTPLTSRFVAPWDTCGWYQIAPDLQVGSEMHTNCATKVLDLPCCYKGADYVKTFDSTADGFNDKQEARFNVERNVVVGVALCDGVRPAWLADWTATDMVLSTDNGNYAIFEKHYEPGAQVTVPGIKEEGHHYIVMIRAADERTPAELPVTAFPAVDVPAYEKVPCVNYVREAFVVDSMDKYTTDGCVYINEGELHGVKIFGSLSCPANWTSRQVCVSASVIPEAGGVYTMGADSGMVKIAADGAVTMGETAVGSVTPGAPLTIRVVYYLTTNTAQVWLNSRIAKSDIPVADVLPEKVVFAAESGSLFLRNFDVSDDTEYYVLNQNADELEASLDVTCGVMTKKPIPFADKPSVALGAEDVVTAAVCKFPALSGVFTFESKVRCETEAFCEVPVLLDKNGAPLLRVAFADNNLFASNGDRWERLYGTVTDWMYYPINNWCLVSVKVDLNKGTYDLWVDGARRAENFALDHAADAVCSAAFTSHKGGELLVQRVRIYDDADLNRGMKPNTAMFDPYDFGAVGDGKTKDTAAVQAAVEAAAAVGGTVYVHDGEFLTGEIQLRSDITFYVDRTAVIHGTADHKDFPLRQPGTSLCAFRQLGRGLLFGEKIRNVRITGGGMLDGHGLYRFKQNDPVADRKDELARPCLTYITYSSDIVLENMNYRRACFWTVVPLSCDNVLFRHLYLDCMYTPNRDGIDPVDTSDMTVYDCAVMAGDDGLCYKSSDPHGSERIDVWDMMLQSLASGFKFGTDTYYSFRDANIKDVTVKNVNRCGISLEAVDGAVVENVHFERFDMVDVGAPIYITVGKRNRVPRGGAPERFSYINNVTFKSMRYEKAYPYSFSTWIREVMAIGQSEEQCISNITFEKCNFQLPGGVQEQAECPKTIDKRYPEYDRHGKSAGSVFTMRYAKNIEVKDLNVTFEKPDARPMVVKFDCEE